MTLSTDLRDLLLAEPRDWAGTLEFIDSQLLPELTARLNSSIARFQIARLPSELLPTATRHRTATNNRVGILLEYSLVAQLNRMLEEEEVDEILGVFVVSNQYPDFTIRSRQHEVLLRGEVKTIHPEADEMSANFYTPVRTVRPGRDIVVVLVWEWVEDVTDGVVRRVADVTMSGAFDAYKLALLRDAGWLGTYTGGTAFKGVDVAGPVINSGAGLKPEEKNMGKLRRIGNQTDGIPDALINDREVARFREFQARLP